MMKRYLTVFLALCLLFMTNICSASYQVTSHEDYGSRWVYLYSGTDGLEANGHFITWEDRYIDKASVHDMMLRGRNVIGFFVWDRVWSYREKMGVQGDSDRNRLKGSLWAIDLENHVCYMGRGPILFDWGAVQGESEFPPKYVYTSKSAINYVDIGYDNNGNIQYYLQDSYKGLNTEQMIDKLFFDGDSCYVVTYDPQTYQANALITDATSFLPVDWYTNADAEADSLMISTAIKIINSRGQ